MQIFRRQARVVDRLKSIDHFAGCKTAELRAVARLAEQVKVAEGEILLREGQAGKEFFLIVSGTVEVTQKGRPMNGLGPGDFFEELAVLNRGNRNATVTALSDLDLLVIGKRESNAMLQIAEFRGALLTRMTSRLQTVDAQLATPLGEQEGSSLETPVRTDRGCPSSASHDRSLVKLTTRSADAAETKADYARSPGR